MSIFVVAFGCIILYFSCMFLCCVCIEMLPFAQFVYVWLCSWLRWCCCLCLPLICWIHVWKKATMIYMTPKPEPTLFANVYFVNDDLPVLLIWSFWYDLSYSIFLNFPLFRVGPVLLLYCIIDVPIMPVAFNYWSYWKSRACKGCGFSVEFNKLCWVL